MITRPQEPKVNQKNSWAMKRPSGVDVRSTKRLYGLMRRNLYSSWEASKKSWNFIRGEASESCPLAITGDAMWSRRSDATQHSHNSITTEQRKNSTGNGWWKAQQFIEERFCCLLWILFCPMESIRIRGWEEEEEEKIVFKSNFVELDNRPLKYSRGGELNRCRPVQSTWASNLWFYYYYSVQRMNDDILIYWQDVEEKGEFRSKVLQGNQIKSET